MQTIGVNIVPGNFPQFVRYSQGDIGRRFKINVVDFDIPSGATVECVATKPSGLGFTVSGTVTDNTVSFITTAIMTDEWGKFPAELRISSGGEVLGTANFMFIGERNPHPEGTTDGQQGTIIPELTLLVNEIRESNARVAEMTASAHTSDVPTAEYDAETNNLEFGIPSIPEEEFLKAFVTDSASGSIASITDGADGLPIKSLNVNIAPKQSGSGDPSPSNVRPISGWDEVEVEQRGKNLLDPSAKSIATGNSNVYYWRSVGTLLKAGTYTVSYKGGHNISAIYALKGGTNTSVALKYNAQSLTFTLTEPMLIEFNFYYSNGFADISDNLFQLEVGSTATAYEPYQGTSYPISLPSTVYGGELDVVSGELVINKGFADLGSLNYILSNNLFVGTLTDGKLSPFATGNGVAISDIYKQVYADGGSIGNFEMGFGSGYIDANTCAVMIKNTNYTDIASFKTAMAGHQLAYDLQDPQTVQLTPVQIETLLGNNNIYADCGDEDVEYRADTKLYIDKLLGNTRTLSMAMAPAPETTEETEDDQR